MNRLAAGSAYGSGINVGKDSRRAAGSTPSPIASVLPVNVRSARRRQERAHQRRSRRRRYMRSHPSSRRRRISSVAAVGSLGSTNSESAARNAAGSVSGRVMNGETASPTTATWSASSRSRSAKLGRQSHFLGPRVARHREERDRIRQVGRQRLGLRATHGHHHRRMEVWAVKFSERRDSLAHLRQPLAGCHHRKA